MKMMMLIRRTGASFLGLIVGLSIVNAPVLSVTAATPGVAPPIVPPSTVPPSTAPTAPSEAAFDHGVFDALLLAHVDQDGQVDYHGLRSKAALLDEYLAAVASADLNALSRDEQLALLINAYNAATLRLITERLPLRSIMDIPDAERWDDARWTVAGRTVSLNQIEHELIRPVFKEPRIHFALVCAAKSCPRLLNRAFRGAMLEAQLDERARTTHMDGRWFSFDAVGHVTHLTMLYNPDWYGADFGEGPQAPLEFAARYRADLRAALAGPDRDQLKVEWIDYDWSLNVQPVNY